MITALERRTSPAVPALAGIWSGLALLLGCWWWWEPVHYPFGPDMGTALDAVPAPAASLVLVTAGVLGMVVAGLRMLGLRRAADGRRPGETIATVATAAVFAAVFGLIAPGMQPLTLIGYLMAIFGPLVLFATVLAGAWRWRGGPVALGVFAAVGALAWITGLADGPVVLGYLGLLGGAVSKAVAPMYLLFFLVGGILWAALGAVTLLAARAGRPAPAWTRPEAAARWGKVAVAVAAVCALPYGLVRLTWLTPWPIGMDVAELAAYPEMRLHGLLLGVAALAGAVLTTGLVSRWGEIWPRWMPVVRGRRVPVAAAVVPGTLVAALFTVAAVPFATMAITAGRPEMVLLFPFPVWGPALGAAVLAYALRRRQEQRDLAQ